MQDNELISFVIEAMNSSLALVGMQDVTIAQSHQALRQGVINAPSAYIYKLYDNPFGTPCEDYKWDDAAGIETWTMSQVVLTTYQISALTQPSSKDPNQRTAGDVVNLLQMILKMPMTIATFAAKGVGVLLPDRISNTPFLDDGDQWEASPNFEVTFSHNRVLTSSVDYTDEVDFTIQPV